MTAPTPDDWLARLRREDGTIDPEKIVILPEALKHFRSDWGVHACFLDKHCIKYGGRCWRIHLYTPAGQLIIALRWQDGAQLWLPWKTRSYDGKMRNYSRWWSPIVWHPRG